MPLSKFNCLKRCLPISQPNHRRPGLAWVNICGEISGRVLDTAVLFCCFVSNSTQQDKYLAVEKLSRSWSYLDDWKKSRVNFVDVWQAHIFFHHCQKPGLFALPSCIHQFHLLVTSFCLSFSVFLRSETGEQWILKFPYSISSANHLSLMLSDWLFLSFREISDLCVSCMPYVRMQSKECSTQGHQQGMTICHSHEVHFLCM